MHTLSISVVSFSPELHLLEETIKSLAKASSLARESGHLHTVRLWLVDNGPGDEWEGKLRGMLEKIVNDYPFIESSLITGHGNVGYGAGHNIALHRVNSRYHLVLNPDVLIESTAIKEALDFMESHPKVACLSPYAAGLDGKQQFLCKRYPTLLDLAVRGFAPSFVKDILQKRLFFYEMRDECMRGITVYNVPIVSGCFMFFRTNLLKELGGFSPSYFLYFEDFDLSLRTGKLAQLAYVPAVKITHYGGHAARKGWSHIKMFVRYGYAFFQKHGWKLW